MGARERRKKKSPFPDGECCIIVARSRTLTHSGMLAQVSDCAVLASLAAGQLARTGDLSVGFFFFFVLFLFTLFCSSITLLGGQGESGGDIGRRVASGALAFLFHFSFLFLLLYFVCFKYLLLFTFSEFMLIPPSVQFRNLAALPSLSLPLVRKEAWSL